MSEQTRITFLIPLRLFCGWILLTAGLAKLSGGWLAHPELTRTVLGWLREGSPYGFYVPFLRDVVLPHAQLFAWIVSLGELALGAALIAGLFTRLAALGGLVLVINYFLGRGDGLTANSTAPMLIMLLTCALANPGRTLGLDAALRGRVPAWLS
jgi:thiosulfate dehydrogenase [quinone] large subunit